MAGLRAKQDNKHLRFDLVLIGLGQEALISIEVSAFFYGSGARSGLSGLGRQGLGSVRVWGKVWVKARVWGKVWVWAVSGSG